MLASEWLEPLQANRFFAGVAANDLSTLDSELFERRSCPAGSVLIEQGSLPDEMYLIVSGTLKVTKNAGETKNVDIIDRGAGDFIGELALLENKARSSTVSCQSDVVVIALARSSFFAILERIPVVYANLARTMAGRQRESDLRTTQEVHRYDALFDLNQQIIVQKMELERLNLELEAKNTELFRLATTDRLTGIYNRTYMIEMLERELAQSRRDQTPLALVLMDIDHFKSFNDTHGHQVGDFVLSETAKLISKSVRPGDTVCRYGGEEFLAALPRTNESDAVAVAENIRKTIEQAAYRFESLELSVTISLGLAVGRPDDELSTIDHISKGADDALYAAKRGGRNRVVPFSNLPPS